MVANGPKTDEECIQKSVDKRRLRIKLLQNQDKSSL